MPKNPMQTKPTCRKSAGERPLKNRQLFSASTTTVASEAKNSTARPWATSPAPARITIISTGMPLR